MNGGRRFKVNPAAGSRVLLDFGGKKGESLNMKLILLPHTVTLTKAIEDHIVTRIEKLEHIDKFVIDARVTLDHDSTKVPEKQFKCSMRLGVRGPDLYAEDWEADLYAAIDVVTKKIEQQIRKRHNKHKASKKKVGSRTKRKQQNSEPEEE